MSAPDDVYRVVPHQEGEPALLVSARPDGQVVTLTLNRPAARNALDRASARDLIAALTSLAKHAEIRVLVLTGAGDRAFCAGADLRERLTMGPAERTAHTDAIAAVADALADFPTPTVAAIRGFALAGGAELAVACDLRIAATDAVFGFPEVAIGIFPGAGGVVRLPRLIGAGAARDLLFTGRRVAAEEAYRLGLVDRLVEVAALGAATAEVASSIAVNAPLAMRALKRALIEGAGQPDKIAHQTARRHRQPLDATADYAEGLAAFGERRAARFRGE